MRFAVAAVAALAIAGSAQASVLFSDNFDANAAALNITTLPGWTVTGEIDLVDLPNGYSIETCAGVCVDLDGTPGPGEITSNPIAFGANQQVLVTFDVSGNQRDSAADEFFFELTFGSPLTYNNNIILGFAYGTTGIYTNSSAGVYLETIGANRSYLTYTYGFIPTASGTLQLRLGTSSGDNIGPILDNVLVTQDAIPEPATWALLIAGFGLVGMAARRRRAVAA